MIVEWTRIRLGCDRKGCNEFIIAQEPTRDEANRRLFEAGWRLCNDRQLCPRCVVERERRKKI